MAQLIVAIDPGVNGGIVWALNGDPVDSIKMPESDVAVCDFLAHLSCKAKDVSLYLEEPPLFAGKNIPGSAIGKLMWNTGVLYGAAVAMGWKIHRIRPAAWLKTHTVGTKGDLTTTQWKNKLKARASELFPNVDVTLWNADALLIFDSATRGVIN
jgi:hypothetical protein